MVSADQFKDAMAEFPSGVTIVSATKGIEEDTLMLVSDIFENVLPLMRRDFSKDEIDAILIGNPRRLLTFV